VIGGRPLALTEPSGPMTLVNLPPERVLADLQRAMTRGAGVLRNAESLATAGQKVDAVALRGRWYVEHEPSAAWAEVRNLAEVARVVVAAAAAREETRGAHTREDFPDLDPRLRARFVVGGPPVASPVDE
jgi:succinate dehydrogenase/fumarate reductase flavoprotein subunit